MKLANPIGRSTEEWIGKTADSVPPPRVQLRVLSRQEGKCALTGVEIRDGDPTDCDHIRRLADGGENRESNLQIVLRKPHQEKTAKENRDGARANRIKAKGRGMKPRASTPIQSVGFAPVDKSTKRTSMRPVEKFASLPLPRLARAAAKG
jgi:5-methylcytosine-specific restriction protein A